MLGALTGCFQSEPQPADTSSEPESQSQEESGESSYVFVNTMPDFVPDHRFPKLARVAGDFYERNSDTVGWLRVPNTHIDDAVVCNDDPADLNNYYYRRDKLKNYSFNGCFYADFRSKFGESVSDISNNTVIYGHTMSADIDGVMFAPLKYYEKEQFARENPYIYFSTIEQDLIWEVFAVFYATVDLPYNRPDLSNEDFGAILNECIKRSLYTYDTQVSSSDKILTLSTCTYSVPGIGPVAYPSKYRYVVMAKQVDKAKATLTEAKFVRNPTPKEP